MTIRNLLVSWDLSKMTIDMVHHLRRATIRKCPFCVGHRFLPNAERALGLLADEKELVEVYSPFSLVISACGSGLFPPLNFTPSSVMWLIASIRRCRISWVVRFSRSRKWSSVVVSSPLADAGQRARRTPPSHHLAASQSLRCGGDANNLVGTLPVPLSGAFSPHNWWMRGYVGIPSPSQSLLPG